MANGLGRTVSRLDPGSLKMLAMIQVGGSPSALATAGGLLWMASESAGTLARIDPSRNALAGRVSVAGAPTSLAAASGNFQYKPVWYSSSTRAGSAVTPDAT